MIKVKKIIINYIVILFILIASYMLLGLLTSLIPPNLIKENVIKSSELLQKDKDKKFYELGYKNEIIFPFTDALMINTAYSIDNSEPMKSFLLARKNYIPGQTKTQKIDTQYDLSGEEKYIFSDKCISLTNELYGLMHGDNITTSYEYARYWHGYLPLLRIELILFDLSVIRVVQIALMIGLVATLAFLLYKKIDLLTSVFFIIGLLYISIFVVANSINESWIFILSIIASIILLTKKDKIKNIYMFFFIVGSVTNYIDLFTVPLISFGFTATIYFLLLQKEEKNMTAKDYIVDIFKIGINWVLGYALTWVFKWIIVEIGLKRDLIGQALEQARFRTESMKTGNPLSVIVINAIYLSNIGLYLLIILGTGYTLEELIRKRKENIDFKENLKNSIPYILIFSSPIVWYLVIKQHSETHHFLTYRLLSISIINLFLVIKMMFKNKELDEDKNKKVEKVKNRK